MKKLKHTREQLQRWVINNRTVFRNGLDNGHSQSEITAFIKTFGLGKSKQTWVPYTAACKIVRKAGIKTFEQFYSWNRPQGMPSNPNQTYRNTGWSSWKEFLGTGKPAMSYKNACKIVRKAGIKTKGQFQSWNRPQGMPSHPDTTYKQSGWSSWKEFLGTGKPNCMKAMSYSQACKIVRKARIKNQKQFQSWNRPDEIPSRPDTTYKQSGWSSWKEFLGTSNTVGNRRVS